MTTTPNTTKYDRVTYHITVPILLRWATGTIRGTSIAHFDIEEDATILGGSRAIDAAVDRCNGKEAIDISSPHITPNPGELGWPIGLA
jgi:hypothetical protein